MSLQSIVAVFSTSLTGSDRLLAIAFANYANDETGQCWPSLDRLASLAGVSRATVKRLLLSFKEKGWLEVVREATHNFPVTYRLRIDRMPKQGDQLPDEGGSPRAPSPEGGLILNPQGAQTEPSRGLTVSPKPVKEEPSREPVKDSPLLTPPKSTKAESTFEAFYQAYPRHEARGYAEKAYAAALRNKIAPELILTATIAFAAQCEAAGTEKKFIPLPASWLNAKRYLDSPNVARKSFEQEIADLLDGPA